MSTNYSRVLIYADLMVCYHRTTFHNPPTFCRLQGFESLGSPITLGRNDFVSNQPVFDESWLSSLVSRRKLLALPLPVADFFRQQLLSCVGLFGGF